MRALWILAVGSLVGCLDSGSRTEQTPSAQPAPKPEVKTPSRRAPEQTPPVAAKVDVSLGQGLEVRRPITDGRLSIIPIVMTTTAPATKYITLHDGMRRGLVSVRELGGEDEWEVDTVRVTNRSKETLVILEGELIEDAMQDRITAQNTTILAGKTERVTVRCVEEDRDHGGTTFHPGNAIAELSLRQTLVHQSQEAVWNKVKQINAREKLAPATNTYRLAAHKQIAGSDGERRANIIKQLEALEERSHIVGFAIAVDGKVMAVDRFATPELYRQLEPELLASYLPTTAGDSVVEGKKLAPDDVRALLTATPGSTTTAATTVLRPL